MTSGLEPPVTELVTSRQRIEALARENGKLAAELEAGGRHDRHAERDAGGPYGRSGVSSGPTPRWRLLAL
jgi:hypothetical protein